MAAPGPAARPAAPESELRAAAALVFVADLDELALSDHDAHHLASVLRIRFGEQVAASDGRGAWRICTLAYQATSDGVVARSGTRRTGRSGAVGRRAAEGVRLEPAGDIRHSDATRPALEVGFSLAKADRTEWAVAKLVELGVDRLSPLIAERTVVRPEPGTAATAGAAGGRLTATGAVGVGPARYERLRRIVRESAMQARRPVLPTLHEPVAFSEVVARAAAGGEGALALAEPGGSALAPGTTTILVGPEGGWSPGELRSIERHVSLGDGVLRVETAAVAAGALLTAVRCGALLAAGGSAGGDREP